MRYAAADVRSFTQTYEYTTMPQGKTALELWHTQSRSTWDATTPQAFQQILEIEHGITDKWDVALYNVFEQVSAGDPMIAEAYHFSEVKLETRYRLADRGMWPVDTLLYFEIAKEFGGSVYEAEAKVIGARDFDKLTVAANAIAEIKFGKDVPETEPEFGFAVGAAYSMDPKLRLGAESWGAFAEGEAALSVGPALSVAPVGNLWLAVTAGFGLTDDADAFRARAIIGIEL